MKEKINNFIIGFYLNKYHSLKSNNEYFKIKLRVYSCIEKRTKMYVLKNVVLTLKDWIQINDGKLINKSNVEKYEISYKKIDKIELKNINFSYKEEKNVLDNVNYNREEL